MEDLQELFLRRARLIRVQQQGEQTVPVTVLYVLQAQFVAMITKHLPEPERLTAFLADMKRQAMPGWTDIERFKAKELPS